MSIEEVRLDSSVIKYSVTEQSLKEIEEQYHPSLIPADLSDKENYEMVRKGIAHVRGLRGDVESKRKELKKDALEFGRKVDEAAKQIKDRLLAVETPMKEAKQNYDTAIEIAKREAARKEEERQQI